MEIDQIPINGFDDNFSYFVGDGKSIGIIDPGDFPLLERLISQGGYSVKSVLLTHSHYDHTDGVRDLVKKYGVPVYLHKNGRGRLEIDDQQCVLLNDGEEVKIGEAVLKTLYTPGHLDDAVCYLGDEVVFTGDTLFVEGCGRSDLPGSNVQELFKSLQLIKELPDDTKVYPGHNYGSKPVSDIAWEKKHNRYLKCKSLEEFEGTRMG